MNTDTTPPPSPPPVVDLIPEAELAGQLSLQRSVFTEWRKAGQLTYPAHFVTRGRGEIVLTVEGRARVEELLQHPPGALTDTSPAATAVEIEVTARGANPRNLRGRVVTTGARCTVRLLTPRVFASQFAIGVKLLAVPAATDGVFEYEGKAARKTRI